MIVIASSNLQRLHVDVTDLWPRRLHLRLDDNAIHDFPAPLMRLDPSVLSITGNQLTQVPLAELFGRGRSLSVLDVSNNPIQSLPSNVDDATIPEAFWGLFLANTSVSDVPQWLQDTLLLRQQDKSLWHLSVVLSGSPVCTNITATVAASVNRTWQHDVYCEPMWRSPLRTMLLDF
ncbi:hypothetical protein P43SY_004231 [Pythium insidiosum]|uniref:Uncharacterized protein n=1 Tax=Pythium insidiosum TaxID=114742 RepID=A0AAD5M0X2_PYTIN|nr:hypothetical protein P43SY_004231 [Pythium insidiosum]